MAKSEEKILARKLRQKGKSIRHIANSLGVSKGTVSVWCRDIILDASQLNKLKIAQERGRYQGQLKGAESQKNKRLKEIEKLRIEGIREIPKLSDREFFIAGIAIYWGEGFKTGHKFGISNSDPKVILFMIDWMMRFCNVNIEDFSCEVGINELHGTRIKEVENYWSRLTGIPLDKFTKTSLKKSKSKKLFENDKQHFGTLRLHVRKSSKNLRKMLGWIEGLSRAV